MGLAASQARLLTITARLADNELRSQTINNAKMRLAAESAQASNEYVSALNNAQLMFSNTSENGLAQTQALTFNALTQYSQYNNQYGIVNSSGQLLVSEKDAKIFEAHQNDLEGFLKAQGLEWDTTYFDDENDLFSKITSFYGTGYDSTDPSYAYIGDLFSHMPGDKSLKELYLDAISQDASIENLNYSIVAQNYYRNLMNAPTDLYPDFRNYFFTDPSGNEINETNLIAAIGTLSSASNVMNELLQGHTTTYENILPQNQDGGAPFALNNLKDYLTDEAAEYIRLMLTSLRDQGPYSGYASEIGSVSKNTNIGSGTWTNTHGTEDTGDDDSITYNTGTSYSFHVGDVTVTIKTHVDTLQKESNGDLSYSYISMTGPHTGKYNAPSQYAEISISDSSSSSGTWTYNGSPIPATGLTISNNFGLGASDRLTDTQIKDILASFAKTETETDSSDGSSYSWTNYINYFDAYPDGAPPSGQDRYQLGLVVVDQASGSAPGDTNAEVYKTIAAEYFARVFTCISSFDAVSFANAFDPSNNLYAQIANDFGAYGVSINVATEAECLLDFDKLIRAKNYNNTTDASGAITGTTFTGTISFANPALTERMKSVLGSYMVEKMVDVLGEPKFTWVDKSSMPTDNPDAKAQWLTNLFNRMQSGYKVLENGLANSREWMEYAFESGLVSMEQVDLSYNWISMDYKTCSSIFDDTDNTNIVAKAEAKYNRSMNDIKQKDSMYDLQLKNIDTEHTSLQTEYDVIKGVINKNIERTMKFDQSA